MTTRLTIHNAGPYLVTIQRGNEPEIILEPYDEREIDMWAGADIKIVEPPGFPRSADDLKHDTDPQV